MKLEDIFSYRDIRIEKRGESLLLENSMLRRELDLSKVIPRTVELLNKSNGKRMADAAKKDVDFSFIGYNSPDDRQRVDYVLKSVEVSSFEDGIFDSERVETTLVMIENVQRLVLKKVYIMYPGAPFISSKSAIEAVSAPSLYWSRRSDLRKFNSHFSNEQLESRSDSLLLSEGFTPKRTIMFAGRTDYTDDQVIDTPVDGAKANGNLLFCEDTEGDGVFILQEAPPSDERRDYESHDFRFDDGHVYSCGWGIEPDEIGLDELWGYRHTIGLYSNDGTNGSSQLKRYLKKRFPIDPEKHCSVMVNPWGCGQFPKLVGEQFLEDELRAASKLNATHYQIDDGWQKGQVLSELSLNNRVGDKEFWEINRELLPNGFEPLIKVAKEEGVEPALWIAPSSNLHYRDWKEFAEIILNYHREYGFRLVKIDFIRTRTKDAEDNLEKMLRYLREESNGEIYFNLDTTNGQRPGYFLFLEYGNIFLENRYVCHNWGLGYHPEKTLRCLWRLAGYMRPQALQIEFTDPGIINYESYEKKGMEYPDQYDPEYWAGIAMFANPLAWLAPSRLEPKYAEIYRNVIALHRKYANEIFFGEIYPIGDEPDGSQIAGLQSHNDETGEGFVIVYRELNAPETATLGLKLLDADSNYKLIELSLDHEAEMGGFTGVDLDIELSRPGSWRLFKYQK